MSSHSIQRQSIVSTTVIFLGFGFGALNLIFLQPRILSTEQWGLTRVITESSVLMSSFMTLGSNAIVAKFMPFYKRHLPSSRNDLPRIALLIWSCGLLITMGLLIGFKPAIIRIFGKNNPLFEPYYYTLLFFVFFQGIFIFMETFAWYAGNTLLSNLLKELLFRLLTTICLLSLLTQWIDFDGFMTLFACIYLPASIIIVISTIRKGGFPIATQISNLSRRIKAKMLSLGSFVFLTTISNIAFIACDTLFLASIYSFSQAGIYAVAQYFSQILEVPMRSMQTSSVPLISEYWRAKNMTGLQSVYRKSCINLLVAGIGLGGLIIVNVHNIERFFPPAYAAMVVPIVILVVSRWVNLGTGLNAVIIQLSSYWRFDFASTLVYSFIGIPLNYLLITHYGMIGAAIANLVAMVIYNSIRFVFLWIKFGLQPFTLRNLAVLMAGMVLIAAVYFIPALDNLYVDAILRSGLFVALFGFIVIRFRLSDEIMQLWEKWSRKLLRSK